MSYAQVTAIFTCNVLRLVQAVLKDGSRGVLIRVTKWVAENMEGVVATKPAVYVAVALVDQLAMLMKSEESWRVILESIVTTLLEGDKVRNNYSLFIRVRNLLIVGRGGC